MVRLYDAPQIILERVVAMYNDEIKKQYIEYKESSVITPKNYLNRVFNDVGNAEKELECDLACWDESHIFQYYIDRHETSAAGLIAMHGRLAEYVDYVRRHKLLKVDENAFENITNDALRECLDTELAREQYINKEQLIHDVRYLDNPVDQFVIYCLWEGIKGKGFEHIWRLKLDDIYRDHVIINGQEIETMDDSLFKASNESVKEYYYYQYGDGEVTLQMYGAPDQIIKCVGKKQVLEISDDPVMVARQNKNIFRKYERSAETMGWERVRPRTLMISGQIEYAKRLADKKDISLEELLHKKEYLERINKKYRDVKIKNINEFLMLAEH